MRTSRCSGTVRHDRLRSLLNLLDEGLVPDSETYASILKDCRDSNALTEGRRVHSHISKQRLDRTTFLGNFLIQMYGRCGSPQESRQAFDNIAEPNSYSWNLLLSAYAQNGHLHESERLFATMPDRPTVAFNIMINVYGQHGRIDSAKQMFDSIQKLDLVSWNSMIAVYAKNERGRDAFVLFQRMDLFGFPPNKVTFVSLLDGCSTATLKTVKLVHSLLDPFEEISSDVVVSTALVNLYGKFGAVSEAKRLFDQMPEPNVVTWTTMVIIYLQNGDLVQGRRLFDQMPQRSIVSWNAMIGTYAHKGHVQQAEEFFLFMPNHDMVSLNSMLLAFANAGHIDRMKKHFEDLAEKNLISWNTMITGYAQNGHLQSALDLFMKMQLEGVLVNKVTFVAILDACANSTSLDKGRFIHKMVSESGFPDPAIKNVLIKMYASCGDLEEARRIFDNMSSPDLCASTAMITAYAKLGSLHHAREVFSRMDEPDVIAWTAIVDAYAQNGQLEEAERLFQKMPVKDQMAWNTMVVSYGQNSRVEDAKRIFDSMPRRNTVTWNAMISTYCQNGQCKLALKMFPLMDLDGEQASRVTYLTVLDACALNGTVSEGRMIHTIISDNGMLTENPELGTTLVNMYGRCGSLINATRAFEEMPVKSYISWNAMVTAYAQNGHCDIAADFTRFMELEGYVSNEVTFLSNLFACSHAGSLEDGWKHFISMQSDYNILPKMDHFCCMVDLLGRSGTMEDANDLIDNMPFEPNPIGWKSLLGASRIHCSAEHEIVASDKCFQLDSMDSSLYVLMSNMYTN